MRSSLATGKARRELLAIDGREVAVTLRLNPRARRLIVKVHPSTGEVSVVAPSQRALDRALAFAQGESRWIARQLARVPLAIPFEAGARIPYRGIEHLVAAGEGSAVRDADRSIIRVGGRAEHMPRRLTDFLKREARALLDARTRDYAGQIGAEVKRVTVRDSSSRWGSCSSAKHIAYCWRLIMAPDFVADYVVAHEVAHLREMNHGPRFWRLTRELVDDIETPQLWLRQNGTLLHRYGAK